MWLLEWNKYDHDIHVNITWWKHERMTSFTESICQPSSKLKSSCSCPSEWSLFLVPWAFFRLLGSRVLCPGRRPVFRELGAFDFGHVTSNESRVTNAQNHSARIENARDLTVGWCSDFFWELLWCFSSEKNVRRQDSIMGWCRNSGSSSIQ